MKNTWSIFKRELGSYFTHPIAYALIIVFVFLSLGLTFTAGGFIRGNDANLEGPFFWWHPWIYMLLAPALGMRMWSDEQRSGTLELLGTFPLSPWSAILGKFLAASVVWFLALALTFPIWITANVLGEPDNFTIFSGYIGSFFICCSFLAITMLVSACTRDQVVCLIVSVVICVFMVFCGFDVIIRDLSKVLARINLEWFAAKPRFLILCAVVAVAIGVTAITRRNTIQRLTGIIIAVGIGLFMLLCGVGVINFSGFLANASLEWLTEPLVSFSVWDHYLSLTRGYFRVLDFVWFVTLISACLLGTSAILSAKRA